MTREETDWFIEGVVTSALWSSPMVSLSDGEGFLGDYLTVGDLTPQALKTMRAISTRFLRENRQLIEAASYESESIIDRRRIWWEALANAFWITMSGATLDNFYTLGWGPDEVADALSEAARRFPRVVLYLGDDGRVHSA